MSTIELRTEETRTPADVVHQTTAVRTRAFERDPWIYRFIVGALGVVILLSVGGIIFLSATDKQTPESLVALASAAVGGLAGLLAPSPN